MSKLSRKDKYRDLRQTIESETDSSQNRPSRLSRMAAPDAKAEQRSEILTDPNPVMEDLLGEVKQYNISTGDRVTEDTQLQILHDLSAKEQADARRSEHFEVMEPNEDAGGTTRNLFGSDLSSVLASSSRMPHASERYAQIKKSQEAAQQAARRVSEDPDYLDVFTPGQSADSGMVQEVEEEVFEEAQTPSRLTSFFGRSKKGTKKARKDPSEDEDTLDSLFETTEIFTPDLTTDQEILAASFAQEDEDRDYFAPRPKKKKTAKKSEKTEKSEPAVQSRQEEEKEQPISKAALIFMIVCCAVLVILIILTIYWMSKLGIF